MPGVLFRLEGTMWVWVCILMPKDSCVHHLLMKSEAVSNWTSACGPPGEYMQV